MTIIDNLLARFGYSKFQPAPPAQLMALADGYKWDIPDPSLVERQAKLYAENPFVRTAIDHTASLGAGAIYSVSRLVGEPGGADDEDLPNHKFERLLRRPNVAQSRVEFLRDCLSWYKAAGNLYIFKNAPGEDAEPIELWIVPASMIKPIPDGKSYVSGYLFQPPGQQPMVLPQKMIVHLKNWNPLNPFVGMSAIQSLAFDILSDTAQSKWNLEFFGKNAGKFPGVLAFKHMVADPEWAKLIKQRDDEWGGTNRAALMMLRGVGDTIQYLPAAATQREMEFINSRIFTRSVIFGYLAPGLDSVLAINATQANSDAGKATLIELGVWPMLEQLGQKFEAELLPLYGTDLVGAFDEMRPSKLLLNIAEFDADAKIQTVNEMRQKRGMEPLFLDESQVAALDEDAEQETENRDTALAQIGQPTEPPAKADAGTVTDKNGKKRKLDPRGLMFVAQIGPATPLPGDPTKPPPAPPMPPAQQQPGDAGSEPPAPNDGQAEELAKWEKFVLARLGKAGAREFEPRTLPMMQAARITAALKAADTADDVRAVFRRERETPDLLEVGRRLTAAIERVEKQL